MNCKYNVYVAKTPELKATGGNPRIPIILGHDFKVSMFPNNTKHYLLQPCVRTG